MRGYVAGSLQAEDRIRTISERSRDLSGSASGRLRDPTSIAALVFVALVVIGSRSLVFGRLPVLGQLPGWTGVSGLVGTFTSGWRYADLGSTAAAPAQLGVFSVLGTLLLGATGLARTIVVVGALPFGVFGTWRLGRRITGPGRAAVVAALAYGINPLPRNALADGRFGPLMLYALAPFILASLLRVGGYFPEADSRRWWRAVVATGALVALTTAAWPPAIVLPVMVALALSLSQPIARGAGQLGALWRASLVSAGIGAVLLLPWPLSFLRSGDRLASLGFAFRVDESFSQILRFETGPNGAGVSGWIIAGAALLVLVLASGPRLVWATRAWVLALLSFACVWVPSRFFADVPMPAIEGLLVPAALGVSLAVGLGVAAFIEDVRSFHFGWRQVAAVGGAIALAFPVFAFALDAADGRWHMPQNDWNENLSWMRAEDESGQFRVVWLGNPAVLPVDPVVHGRRRLRGHQRRPGRRPHRAAATGGRCERAGWPTRSTSCGSGAATASARSSVRWGCGTSRSRNDRTPGSSAPIPRRRACSSRSPTSSTWCASRVLRASSSTRTTRGSRARPRCPPAASPRGSPTRSGPRPVRRAARPVRDGVRVPAGGILWSQSYSGAWHASSNGATLPHRKVLGWANGYTLARSGPIAFSYGDQWQRYPEVLVELALVAGAFLLWRGSARFRWPLRRPHPEEGEPT